MPLAAGHFHAYSQSGQHHAISGPPARGIRPHLYPGDMDLPAGAGQVALRDWNPRIVNSPGAAGSFR
jgi:hypothetical protein